MVASREVRTMATLKQSLAPYYSPLQSFICLIFFQNVDSINIIYAHQIINKPAYCLYSPKTSWKKAIDKHIMDCCRTKPPVPSRTWLPQHHRWYEKQVQFQKSEIRPSQDMKLSGAGSTVLLFSITLYATTAYI